MRKNGRSDGQFMEPNRSIDWWRGPPLALMGLMVLAACGGDDPASPDPGTPAADLAATASGPAGVAVGTDATFDLTVTNNGPDGAEGVILEAAVPADFAVTSVSNGGTQSGTTVSWMVGALADGTTASRTVTLAADAEGTIEVVATAASDTGDPDASNNDGSADVATAVSEAMISADVVALLEGNASAATGSAVEWTITLRNDGPSAATDVVGSLTFGAAPPTASATDGGVFNEDVVTWPSVDELPAGESAVFTVTAEAPPIGPVAASASSTASSADAAPGNNDGSAGSSRTQTLVTFDPVRTIVGESPGDQFGWLMDVVGDVDGDGAADFVVGAPTSDAGGDNAGRAYVYSGATGALLHTFTGSAGQRMGFAVDGAGDVDGDGIPDAVVGGPAGGSGRVVVISGSDGSIIHDIAGENTGDNFGRSVGRLGDVNADGFADFLATAPGNDTGGSETGKVYVVDGATGSFLATMSPQIPGEEFGSAVGGIGDLTGDGVPDFAVGASNATGGGRIYVLSGADGETVLFSIAAPPAVQDLGLFWLNSPGDIDGDGLNDIFAPDIAGGSAGSGAGRAFVFSGADGSTLIDMTGEAAGDQFGMGRGIEDVNDDGVGDLFVAAWLNDQGGSNAGKAYVFSGADGSLLRSFVSTSPGENLGFDAIGIGDVTDDGIADFLISGGLSPTSPGRIHVVSGVGLN